MELTWTKLISFNRSLVEQIKTEPGVFRLAYKATDGAFYTFYVGSANKSLREDLLSILDGKLDNICVKIHLENLECFFRYTIIGLEEERKNVLKTVYDHFKPKCNASISGGQNIEINFS